MELMDLLPEYYRGNQTMEELQAILSKDMNMLANNYNQTVNQCFINTATTLLSRYERIYGIKVDISKSEEFRRERIRAKVRGTGTVTKKMMEEVAKSYSNGEVEVIEDNTNNKFIIKFIGTKGMPPNMADLTLTIEEIKPAHLAFGFEYVYNTHAILSQFTQTQIGNFTHQQLREEEIL